MYKRTSKKSHPQLAGLVPVNQINLRKSYGSGELVSHPKGNLYTPEGHFVQPVNPHQQVDTFQPLSGATTSEFNSSHENAQMLGKKEKQFLKWEGDILPTLMEPYFKLLHETDSLRNMEQVRHTHGCPGCDFGKALKVTLVFFESL